MAKARYIGPPAEVTQVFKYPFTPGDIVEVIMPHGAEILTVGVQGEQWCVWARVVATNPEESRLIRMAGTGHTIAGKMKRYINTVHHMGLVFHFFEMP